MNVHFLTRLRTMLAVASGLLVSSAAIAQTGTGFTYQGQLRDSTGRVDGATDFRFRLWDAASAGTTVSPDVELLATSVNKGLFQVELDFGQEAFNGDARWLEVEVRHPAGVGDYDLLASRQRLTAAPYAVRAVAQSSLDASDGDPINALTMDTEGRAVLQDSSGGATLQSNAVLHLDSNGNQPLFLNPFADGGGSGPVIVGSGNSGAANELAINDSLSGVAKLSFIGGTSSDEQILSHRDGGAANPFGIDVLTNGVPRLSVTNSGRVGIGTASPDQALHIKSNQSLGMLLETDLFSTLELGGGADAGAGIPRYAMTLTTGGAVRFRVGTGPDGIGSDASNVMVLRPAQIAEFPGKVGIGTTPSEALEVAGNISATGDVCSANFTCPSDARYKHHVANLDAGLQQIRSLRPVRFDWRRDDFPDRNFSETRQVGFIAQELERALPEAVHQGRDGYYSVDYARLTPVLTSAMQELDRELQHTTRELKQQLAKQQAENESLRAELAALRAVVESQIRQRASANAAEIKE